MLLIISSEWHLRKHGLLTTYKFLIHIDRFSTRRFRVLCQMLRNLHQTFHTSRPHKLASFLGCIM